MNHKEIYEKIIQKAKTEIRKKVRKENPNYKYYEIHHILPKCLGGTNEKENLVLLTAREHYICHKLLTYIHKENRKLSNAFHRMTFSKSNNYNISSKDYEYARYLKANTPISEETRNKMKAHIFSEEHKENLSKSHVGIHYENRVLNRKGELNTFYGKTHSEESKEKIRKKKLGVIQSDETKEKRSKSMMGKNTYERTEETKQKLSKSLTGRKLTEEHKLNISKNSWRRKK